MESLLIVFALAAPPSYDAQRDSNLYSARLLQPRNCPQSERLYPHLSHYTNTNMVTHLLPHAHSASFRAKPEADVQMGDV